MIEFLCSYCGAPLRVRPELAGATGKCPRCGRSVEAPSETPPAGATDPSGAPAPSGAPVTPAPKAGKSSPAQPRAGRPSDSSRPVFDSQSASDKDDFSFLAPAQAPGELGRLGPYRVVKVLGRGGMGLVFEAEDVRLHRRVALKTLKPALAADPASSRRFLREAQAAAAIDHDHIVTIYQADQDHGVPYLAMKLLEGESLEDRLNRSEGRLDAAEAMRIGREVAEGLAAAHARGMIHRDVKPANLWLEAGRDRVKIVDFGLARGADEDVRLTQTGIMIGTPAYMAPEQAEGQNLDHRCDLFSLGCVLYRMTTGELAFKGKTTMAVVTALATKTPEPPRSVDASVPEALSGLIMRLLSKKPSGRPDSAQEVAEELARIERALASEGVPAAAPKGEKDVGAAAALAQEQDEAGDDAAEGENEEATSPARRKDSRASGKRKRRKRGKGGDVNWERRVIFFGIWVAVGIALLIAYLIMRHFFYPPAANPAG